MENQNLFQRQYKNIYLFLNSFWTAFNVSHCSRYQHLPLAPFAALLCNFEHFQYSPVLAYIWNTINVLNKLQSTYILTVVTTCVCTLKICDGKINMIILLVLFFLDQQLGKADPRRSAPYIHKSNGDLSPPQ